MTPKVRPITIDIQGAGAPCIRGTPVLTQAVGERFAAGQSVQEVAVAHGFGVHKVEAALRFELGSLTQRMAAVEIADAGPILVDGDWHKLDRDTLCW